MVRSVRVTAELRSLPARGNSSVGDAGSAAVMSGPFTEDVRGYPWRPPTRQPAEAPSGRCPVCRDEDCWHDRPDHEVPDASLDGPEPDAAEPPT